MVSETAKMEKTNIQIMLDTKARLDSIGLKTDTYDDIVRRLLDEHDQKSKT